MIYKTLFLVAAKKIEIKNGEMNPGSAFYGWRSSGNGRIANEWDERGRLENLSAPCILSWDAVDAVGREVLAIWNVRLTDSKITAENPDSKDPNVGIFALSHPGRGARLGEDGIEEAFGKDAVESCLRCALNGDWRSEYCSAEYRILNDETFEDYLSGYEIPT